MADTDKDTALNLLPWENYVRVTDRFVFIRSNSVGPRSDWDDCPRFTHEEAEGLAAYLQEALAESRQERAEIWELAEDLKNTEPWKNQQWEDIAARLYRKGYRKT